MDIYNQTSQTLSRDLTLAYSTSFSLASKLFAKPIRNHIYNIYGLVRIADEIVDTYSGNDQAKQLQELEAETFQSITRKYSVNPIVHAFQLTANQFGIGKELIRPFFESMAMDLSKTTYNKAEYQAYIYGSAEAVGLMCLKVFVEGDAEQYKALRPGASRLGAAYQKVNFLRDFHADSTKLGRIYFPDMQSTKLQDADMGSIIKDIKADFAEALPAIKRLPMGAQKAVYASYLYYYALLHKLENTSVEVVNSQRIRIPNTMKLLLLLHAALFGAKLR